MRPEARALALIALAAVAVAHVAWFGSWVVEDAAISWAYAENLGRGLGPVPWPGAEPVEGYSNPTWTLLLAVLSAVGLHPYWGSKLLAMGLTASTVFLVHRLAARVVPGQPVAAGLAAAALFAVNTQVGIFGAAGLENPLFNFLLAAALLRTLREQDTGGAPWSAALWTLLALTRPEGIAYALVAGGLTTAARMKGGVGRPAIARWWLALLAPLLLWHVARWQFFAWELPATAYAKLPEGREHLLLWDGRGWRYLRNWALSSGQGLFLPFYVLAIAGTRGRSARIGAVLLVAGAALYGIPHPGPDAFDSTRCLFPLVALAVLWFASLDTPLGHTRGPLWAMGGIATFFAVYARGDWMEGSRWMAMAAVPSAVLLAAGFAELLDRLRTAPLPRLRPLGLATWVAAFSLFQVQHTHWFGGTLEISPWMVRERVWKGHEAAARLHLDERPRILTVDMGGFLMWSGWEINDIVGLVDMPMAQHRHAPWFKPFFRQYILEERQPHFIRVGSVMAELKTMPGFHDRYIRSLHGWRVRRDLLFSPRWSGAPNRRVAFDGWTLEGWEVPAGGAAAGGTLHLQAGIGQTDQRTPRWWAFALAPDDTVAAAWDLPIYSRETVDWAPGAIYQGSWSLQLPADLPPGDYRLGFVMRTFDAPNAPLPDQELPAGATVARTPAEAHFRPGEVRFAEGFTVFERAEAESRADAARDRAVELAAAGRCEQAHRAWFEARSLGLGLGWSERHAPQVHRALAMCWQSAAAAAPDRATDFLERALTLDPAAPGLHEAATALADRLEAEGDRLARTDPLAAIQAWSGALRLDPYRTWVRRRTEEARTAFFQGRLRRSAAPEAE